MTASISLARVLQISVPIQWQEAIAVARAASLFADRYNRRLTLHGCAIAPDGSVTVGENDTDRIGQVVSEAQLVAALLDGRPAPAQLRHLLTSADGPLAVFPSERHANGKPITLSSFLQPNAVQQVARLARRALAASRGGAVHAVQDQPAAPFADVDESSATQPPAIRTDLRTLGWRAGIAAGLIFLIFALGSVRGAAQVSGAASALAGVVEDTAAAVGLSPGAPSGAPSNLK